MAYGCTNITRLTAAGAFCVSSVITLSSISADACASSDVSLSSLTFVTEEYPPYNYLADNGLAGKSIDLLEAILEHTNTPFSRENILYYPWVRGYNLALNEPNTVLFSTTRTPARENQFHWVGPIAEDHVVLLARSNVAFDINTLEDAIDQGLSVAVIREDIGAQALTELSYPEHLVRSAIDNRSALYMLLHGRVDLWAYSADVAEWIAQEEGYAPDSLKPVYTLMGKSYLYFAINQDTDPRLVTQMQQALDEVTNLPATAQAMNDG